MNRTLLTAPGRSITGVEAGVLAGCLLLSLAPAAVAAPGACDSYSSDTTFAECGYPTAATAGVPPGSVLTPRSAPKATGLVIDVDGTVINAIDLDGWIDVQANNVTIKNSVITSNNWWGIKYAEGKTGLRVLHNTIKSIPGQGPDNGGYDYGIAQLGTGSMEIGWNDISGFKDGIDVATGNIHDNYIHDLSQFEGAHTQNIYVWCGGDGVVLKHNTLVNQTAKAYSTAAVYIAPDCGRQNDVTVRDNWLAGGSLVLYAGGANATNIRIRNNKFSTEVWSPMGGFNGTVGYWSGGNAGNLWTGNVWANGPNAGKPLKP